MLVAAGIFHPFIQAVAEVTRLNFNRQSLLLLGAVGGAAAVAIATLAGLVGNLVVTHTWIMYSFFIGLTLGGAPLIWRMAGTKSLAFWLGAAGGIGGMIAVTIAQTHGADGGAGREGFLILFLAGVAGAAAMVLPGISGGYLLLLMGVYVPILEGIDRMYTAVRALDFAAVVPPALQVVLPVGLGVLIGVAAVSNLVKVVLTRFPRVTLGLLFGLLLGAVAGLWPFQAAVEPAAGDLIKEQTVVGTDGVLVYKQTGAPIDTKDFPRYPFVPAPGQAGTACVIILLGFGVTSAVARIGGDKGDVDSNRNQKRTV